MAPLGVRLGCREGLPARPGHVRGPWWVQVVVVVGVGGVWAGRQEAIDERVGWFLGVFRMVPTFQATRFAEYRLF